MSYIFYIENCHLKIILTEPPSFLKDEITIDNIDEIEIVRLFNKKKWNEFYKEYFEYHGWEAEIRQITDKTDKIEINLKYIKFELFSMDFDEFKKDLAYTVLEQWVQYFEDNSYFYYGGDHRWDVLKIIIKNGKINSYRLKKKIWAKK